jgi:hypothetical protein
MPLIEIKSVISSPTQKVLSELSEQVKTKLKMGSTSRIRMIWNSVNHNECFGMGVDRESKDLSIVILFYTRDTYPTEDLRHAMQVLYYGVSKAVNVNEKSVLIIHQPIAPGHLLSSNGFWTGGEQFYPVDSRES